MILRKASQSAKYLTAAMALESKQLKCADLDIKISKPKKKKKYVKNVNGICREIDFVAVIISLQILLSRIVILNLQKVRKSSLRAAVADHLRPSYLDQDE